MVCAVYESIRSEVVSLSTTVVEQSEIFYNQLCTTAGVAAPEVSSMVERVQSAWSHAQVHAQPHLQTAREILFSPLGVAAALLTGALVCMCLARKTDNRIVCVALIAIGMTACIGSGICLAQSGMVPLIIA
jgi:hypothetical protein